MLDVSFSPLEFLFPMHLALGLDLINLDGILRFVIAATFFLYGGLYHVAHGQKPARWQDELTGREANLGF